MWTPLGREGISHQGVPEGEDKVEKFPVIQLIFVVELLNYCFILEHS